MSNLNILTEDTCTLPELVKELPSCQKVNPATVWRWHKRGVKGVKLEAVRVGHSFVSSKQALTRFLQAISA